MNSTNNMDKKYIYSSMKQNKGPLLALTIITIFIFKKNAIIQKSILDACNLFLKKLFPSLFPMMIITDFFIYFGLPELLCKYFGNIFSKLFHTSPFGAFAFFISCFSGTPANAYVIKNLYYQNYLTEEEASKILSFTFFSNPLFLYTMLNLIFPNNPSSVIKLLLLPYIVNLFIGLFSKKSHIYLRELTKTSKESFGNMFASSIKNAMNTLLMILGTITIFYVINALINPLQIPLITGLLEISQGLNRLIYVTYSIKIKEILATMMISFGGLSIHLQIKGILSDTNISYISFLKGRILQTILSVIFIIIV